ncbi:hypothetical protein FMIA91_10670 [Fidelibacter multiformis]
MPLDRAEHIVTENQDFTVDYGQFDGNRICTWTSNVGDWVSYRATSYPGMEWPKGSEISNVFQSGLFLVSGQTKEKDSLAFREDIRTAVVGFFSQYQPGQILYFDTLNQVVVPVSHYPQEHCIWKAGDPADPSYRLYKINRHDSLSADYLNWPAEQGAPVDESGKPLFSGDQMVWSVCNDMDTSLHTSTLGGAPMGVEIQTTLYGFDRSDILGDVLFIRSLVINKSDNHYKEMYAGIWAAPELGMAWDNCAGVDTSLTMGYVFNGVPEDLKYGLTPPAVGFTFLQRPQVQSPGDTASWSGKLRPGWREVDLSGFIVLKGSPTLDQDPHSTEEAYHVVRGLKKGGGSWIDPMTGEPTRFHYTGDPVTGEGWLNIMEVPPGDRRFLFSAGPFEMAPCDTQEIVTAIIVAQGHNHIRSVAALRFAKEYVQTLFDTQFDFETTATVADVIDAVRPENLDYHVRVLSGDTTAMIGGSEQRIEKRYFIFNTTVREENDVPLAEQYLTETLESYGYSVTSRPIGLNDLDINDLLIFKEGTEYPDSCILMTAFYDGIECWSKPSVINPNADLNASGVAALLECARILKDVDTPYSILFALWGSWQIGATSFKEWPDNPWWDQILFNVDVEAIGYDTLNLREIVPQYSDREGNIAIQSYVLDRMQSVLYQNAVNLSIGRRWQGTTYGQADPLPSISFTQSIYHPDTSYEYLISNPNMHGFGRDDMEFFDLPVFHDRARAVIGLVADLALHGIPENLPTEIKPVIKPESFALYPNYPNPFNPVTHIEFSLPEPAQITLNIYDITGRLVEQLVNQHIPAGYHTVTWDASSYSSGVYIARLKAGSSVKTQKMVLMK